jgi:hypothetical protein
MIVSLIHKHLVSSYTTDDIVWVRTVDDEFVATL